MILHFFNNDKFLTPFLDFMNTNFDKNDHVFIIWGGVSSREIPIIKQYNVIDFNEDLMSLVRLVSLLKKADKIILHSLYNRKLSTLLFFLPAYKKKIVWIVWGGDLYPYIRETIDIKLKAYDIIRSNLIKRANIIAALVEGDLKIVSENYKTNAKLMTAIYMSDERTKHIKILNEKEKINNKDTTVNILVGNSATESNQHKEILGILQKFKKENINIYCPLSYGNETYAKEVRQIGNQLFGNKFISIDNLMSMKEYMELLDTMDIGIFNNNRQQGLGNIYSLMYLGKKVYIRNDTSMWEETDQLMGLKIFSISDLKDESYANLIKFDEIERATNINILEVRYSKEHMITLWSKIFY